MLRLPAAADASADAGDRFEEAFSAIWRGDVDDDALNRLTVMVGLRSRLSGIATGDQAIFVRREWFVRAGGFPDIPLMEDVAMSRALKRLGPPLCLRETATTSSRRWEERGIARTMVLMWRLRLEFWLGADPARLAGRYR